MTDAASIAVLRDLFAYVIVALALGAAAYGVIRHMALVPILGDTGKVPTSAMGWQESLVALLLLGMLAGSFAEPGGKVVEGAESQLDLPGLMAGSLLMLLGALAVLMVLRARGHDLGEIFGLRHLSWKQVLTFAGLAMIPALVITICSSLAVQDVLEGLWPEAVEPQKTVELLHKTGGLLAKLTLCAVAVICAPLSEEILFRGFLYPVMKRFTDGWLAAPLNALLFAVVHLHVGSAVPLFLLGLILVAAYELTGCLLVPLLIHAFFNGFNALLLLSGVSPP
jgi:uncharacterized protein